MKLNREPNTSDDDRQCRRSTKDPTVDVEAMCESFNHFTEDPGKSGHCKNAAESEGNQVCKRITPGRETERRKHAKEMRASRDAVEDTDPAGCVRMAMRLASVNVNVDVRVGRSRVLVCMRMNFVAKCLPPRPDADADQYDADKAFARNRECLGRKRFAQEIRAEPDDPDACRVADPPDRSGAPSLPSPIYCDRGDGCDVIRAGQNVYEAGQDSAQDDEQRDSEVSRNLCSIDCQSNTKTEI